MRDFNPARIHCISRRRIAPLLVFSDWSESRATWNCAVDTDVTNSSPDCDPEWNGGLIEEPPSDSVLHFNGLEGDVNFDVTADVADFLSGQPNHGWIVKKREEGQSGLVEYDSREALGNGGPELALVFELPPGPDTTPPQIAIVSPAQAVIRERTDPSPPSGALRPRVGDRSRFGECRLGR